MFLFVWDHESNGFKVLYSACGCLFWHFILRSKIHSLMMYTVVAKSQCCSGSIYKNRVKWFVTFWFFFFFKYLWLGNTFVGRNWITESYHGCYPNNSPSGGNYWQFWKAENKGYKGNKLTIKVQNMFSNLI